MHPRSVPQEEAPREEESIEEEEHRLIPSLPEEEESIEEEEEININPTQAAEIVASIVDLTINEIAFSAEEDEENNPIVMYIEDDIEFAIASQYFSNQLSQSESP